MNWVIKPGLTKYAEFIPVMEKRLNEIIAGTAQETIYLLEHEEVYSAGSNYQSKELLNTGNIKVIETGRGGKVTYHGPGQTIIYPLLDLKLAYRQRDIKLYVRKLEQVIINTLLYYSLKPYLLDNHIGIWVDYLGQPAKIAAIGIRIRKWVTYHGAAINVTTNLSRYKNIIPCGITEFATTSLQELGIKIMVEEFNHILRKEFNKIFTIPNT